MMLSFSKPIRLTFLLATSLFATLSLSLSNLGLGASNKPTFQTYTVGKNGFVFENLPEIARWDEDHLKIAVKLDEHIEIIQAINNALKKRNIKLVIALIPMVHSVYSNQLPNGFVRPRLQRELYGVLQQRLNRLGVETPNLEQAFMQHPSRKTLVDPLFMRTDHHWSPTGGLEAARVIAQHIQSKHAGILAGIPEVKYDIHLADRKTYPLFSSLYKKLPASEQAKVKLDQIRVPEFALAKTDSGSGLGLGLGLLTDTTPRIIEVGSSFSDIDEFGFVGGLAYRLSRDVLNAAHGGVESFVPMAEYLASDAYQNNPPAMIVWEMPIKLMVFGMRPINNADEWSARQYLLEVGVNLPGACENGLRGRITHTNGFQIQGSSASVTSSTKASFVKYEFAAPIKDDQYLSLNVTSSTSDSLVIEGDGSKPPRYFVKLGDYAVTHRVNVPLATLANGKTSGLNIRVSAGSQLRLEEPTLCSAAPELMRLARGRQ
jgi:SGNH hydrolase-like domain, acetyltransferase AlgX